VGRADQFTQQYIKVSGKIDLHGSRYILARSNRGMQMHVSDVAERSL
jgi:hypothetical protein